MPALQLLGRRWHIAADDLPLPSLMGALWHIAVLVLNSVDLAYVTTQLDTSCPYRRKHIAYLSSHLACFIVNTVLHTWTLFESVQGTMFQVHRRSRVGPLVLAIILFYGLTIVSNGYGTRLVYTQYRISLCEPLPGPLHLNHFTLTEAVVITTWVSLFVGFLAIVVTLNLFSTYQTASSPWLNRFRLYQIVCFCCLGPCGQSASEGDDTSKNNSGSAGRNLSPMVVIANIFTHIFGGVDMVLTDYIAALTLLGVRHSKNKPAHTYANTSPPQWLEAGAAVRGTAVEIPRGSWRRAPDGTDVILEPPPVVELAASSRSVDGLHATPSPPVAAAEATRVASHPHPHPGAALAANHVAIELEATTISSSGLQPTTTTTTTTTCDATCNGSDPTVMATTTTHTTTSAPSTPAKATAVVGGALNAANGAKATSARVPAGACGDPQRDVEAAEVAAPGSPQAPDGGLGEGCRSQQWDPANFAQPNASEKVMEEALHYMRFATAVYGWKMFLWMNRLHVTSCCRLCMGRSCGCCRQSSYFIRGVGPDYGPSEGCCTATKLLEREAITQLTGVQDNDILYVSYDNRVGGLLPYYVAVDRDRRSVVVGVRGSLSLRDVVTDLLCEPAEYDVAGVPSTDGTGRRVLWAHRGMLESTRAIQRDIEEQGVLQAAVAAWPEGEAAQQQALRSLPSERARAVAQRLRGSCSGFRVVITGHSLGAGVTGLLGPLIQKDFPNLRCWAFAPPGGLMSPKAAELTHGFCISVTHAKDMIPRLGVRTMESLVQALVDVSVSARVNKLSIMGRLMLLGERPPREQLFRDDLDAELQAVLDAFDNRLRDTPNWKVGEQFDGARDFVPPGHMLYVERRKQSEGAEPPHGSCSICLLNKGAQDAQYACRWIRVQDLMGVGLVISRSMFLDHLPDNTMYAMEAALAQMRGDLTSPSRRAFNGRTKRTTSSSSSQAVKAHAAAPAALPDAADADGAAKDSPV